VVDWIAALPDLLVTTTALAGVWLFSRQDGAPRGLQIAGHCVLYLAALLTKETGVMLAPLYAGFGFFCLGRRWSEIRRNAGLYGAMALTFGVYLLMRGAALGGLAPGQQMYFHLGPTEFLLSAVVIAGQYLGALVFPAELNYFHIFHATRSITPQLVMSAAALAAVAVAFWRSRVPLVSYGLFWMAVALAPVMNLTGVGPNVFAERYLYLPSAGFCWIAGWAWDWLARRNFRWAAIGGALALAACAARTVARNRDWKDDFALFTVTVRQSPASGLVQDALAAAYVERDQFDKGLEHERLAVQYDPEMPPYRKKLGYILIGKDPAGAVAEFEKLVSLRPQVAEYHSDLALGLESAGDLKRALREYETALQLQPQYKEAREGYQRVRAKLPPGP
jgi:tetratricopeptide (TPR) repeat protein